MRFASFIVIAAAVCGFAQTVDHVKADIANISSQVNALDAAINKFPSSGGTLAGALAIHNDATSLEKTLSDATDDVNATLGSVQAIVPVIEDALVQIVAKRPAFDALPLGGVSNLIRQDLGALRAYTYDFAGALYDASPADLHPQIAALRTQIDNDFATAQAGYT